MDGLVDAADICSADPDCDDDLVSDGANDPDGGGPIAAGPDNCPSWPNALQNLPPWPISVGDPDCDGYTTADENFMGTDPNLACSATGIITHPGDSTKVNDETVDNWPPDFNDSQKVDIFDIIVLKPAFFKSLGQPGYNARVDLNASNKIDIFDIIRLKPFFFLTCTP